MKLAILQPVLIPDLHDLSTMMTANHIVYQDTEQWSRKGRTHRALIRTPEGTDYISIPVMTADKKKSINKVRIDHARDWISPMLRSLKFNYSNSVYYDFYEPEVRADIEMGHNFEYLLDFSLFLRKRLFQFLELEISAKIDFSSGMEGYTSDPDEFAKQLGAEIYYQEHDARHYQRQGKNQSELKFTHPEYRQHFEGFEPWCCLYDLLFQYGPESFRIFEELD
ncbi:WbqC family protein [Rhodohalobacter halophilus]|uniref:WbqC family protein n=1 Tax=Rhodohalobacter halophilus TaxID=1812810 RepID=UPI00083FB3F8|nr:WbqC family protein [Rhodohalobacter halophilus]